ncbi:MAG: hypothetical protein M0R06_11700 [Sphaerochaeta sp.]|jgi:hypothetical protein|nr:hypothetical protein [Sphaerochaeta sp.]
MAFDPNGYNPDLVYLLDIEIARRLDTLAWTQAAAPNTACWYVSHPEGEPSKVEGDGAAYTQNSSLASCQAGTRRWFYDATLERLYVHITGGGSPAEGSPYLASYHWVRLSTDYETYDGHPYRPCLARDAIPSVSSQMGLFHEGGCSLSFGSIKILNGDGYFDTLFDAYIWEAKEAILRIGEKGKGDANYAVRWYGWTGDIEEWTDDLVTISTEDLRTNIS